MTEGEWLGCRDWRDLFDFPAPLISDRKLRLFAVACCRATSQLLSDEGRSAVDVAERYADGKATQDELQAVRNCFRASLEDPAEVINGVRYRLDFGGTATQENAIWAAKAAMRNSADAVATAACRAANYEMTSDRFGQLLSAEMGTRRQLLWEVVGPPAFRPMTYHSQWRSADSLALARKIYEDRAFECMPMLADAISNAGCDDELVLAHCRSPGPHVRGCWALDLILDQA